MTTRKPDKIKFVAFCAVLLILVAALGGKGTPGIAGFSYSEPAGFVIMFAAAAAYFVPTIIAFNRGNPNRRAIAATNILLGWTVLGWVVAFIWSLTGEPAAREA